MRSTTVYVYMSLTLWSPLRKDITFQQNSSAAEDVSSAWMVVQYYLFHLVMVSLTPLNWYY